MKDTVTFDLKVNVQTGNIVFVSGQNVHLSHLMIKPTKLPLRPAKAQIAWAFVQSDQSSLSA